MRNPVRKGLEAFGQPQTPSSPGTVTVSAQVALLSKWLPEVCIPPPVCDVLRVLGQRQRRCGVES